MTATNGSTRGYALCTVGRTGSNWFCQLLSSTDQLGYPLEYFNGPTRRLLTDPAYPDDPAEQIDRILTMGTSPNGVYAIKVFPGHIDAVARDVAWTRRLPNLKFVHLERHDLLGQALSLHRAEETKQFRSTQKSVQFADYDGRKDLDCLHLFAREQARWRAFFSRNDIRPLRLVYEDVAKDPQAACDALSAFLEVAPCPAIDWSRIDLTVQRDAVTEDWRSRFMADYADLDRMDAL